MTTWDFGEPSGLKGNCWAAEGGGLGLGMGTMGQGGVGPADRGTRGPATS